VLVAGLDFAMQSLLGVAVTWVREMT